MFIHVLYSHQYDHTVEGMKWVEKFREGVVQRATEVYNCRSGRRRRRGEDVWQAEYRTLSRINPFLGWNGMRLKTQDSVLGDS